MIQFYNIDTLPRERFRLAHSLFLLGTLKETAGVVDWLRHELDRLDRENRSERDPALFRVRQGACQTIANLLHEIAEADKKASDIQAAMQPAY